MNAASTRDRAATSTDSARSKSSKVWANVAVGWLAQSVRASVPRPVSVIATASAPAGWDGIASDG